MRRLVVFDIDGTLTDTVSVDDECYLRAVADVLDLDRSLLDWSDAPHVTDAGILEWLADRHSRGPLNPLTTQAVVERFIEYLECEAEASPHRFGPVAGAREIVGALRQAHWHVALATGAWEPSARLKLERAGIDTIGVALASATDAPTRTAIMRLAAARARRDGDPFDRTVSVGDGVWDVRAARDLGWPFVGIASGERANALRRAGAAAILPDLADVDAFVATLDTAQIPRAL